MSDRQLSQFFGRVWILAGFVFICWGSPIWARPIDGLVAGAIGVAYLLERKP